MFKRLYRTLSGLSLGSLRERENNQYTSAEKCSHLLSTPAPGGGVGLTIDRCIMMMF